MTARERRRTILEVLNQRRHVTRENLAYEFGVTARMIDYDIEKLSLEYPIYTVPGRGGGVYVDENFELRKEYLTDEQAAFLERITADLSPEDSSIAISILQKFGFQRKRRRS